MCRTCSAPWKKRASPSTSVAPSPRSRLQPRFLSEAGITDAISDLPPCHAIKKALSPVMQSASEAWHIRFGVALLTTGGDDLQRLVAGIELHERQHLLKNHMAQQVAAKFQFAVLTAFPAAALFTLAASVQVLLQLAQLEGKEGQAQQLKAAHLLHRLELTARQQTLYRHALHCLRTRGQISHIYLLCLVPCLEKRYRMSSLNLLAIRSVANGGEDVVESRYECG